MIAGNSDRNGGSNCGNEKESFKKHRDHMKLFRGFHGRGQKAGPRQDLLALIPMGKITEDWFSPN